MALRRCDLDYFVYLALPALRWLHIFRIFSTPFRGFFCGDLKVELAQSLLQVSRSPVDDVLEVGFRPVIVIVGFSEAIAGGLQVAEFLDQDEGVTAVAGVGVAEGGGGVAGAVREGDEIERGENLIEISDSAIEVLRV